MDPPADGLGGMLLRADISQESQGVGLFLNGTALALCGLRIA